MKSKQRKILIQNINIKVNLFILEYWMQLYLMMGRGTWWGIRKGQQPTFPVKSSQRRPSGKGSPPDLAAGNKF